MQLGWEIPHSETTKSPLQPSLAAAMYTPRGWAYPTSYSPTLSADAEPKHTATNQKCTREFYDRFKNLSWEK